MFSIALSHDIWPWTVFSVICILVIGNWIAQKHGHPLPPGPTPLPIVGNVWDLPRVNLGRHFSALSKKYGDITHLKVFGQHIILLGSRQAVHDLLEKRSLNYSDRPKSIMVELTGFEWLFILGRYGQDWRQQRRAFHSQMSSEVISRYEDIQLQASRGCLRNLLVSPRKLSMHLDFMFASTVMRMIYGVQLQNLDDQQYKVIRHIAKVGEEVAVPGRFTVEAIPALRYLPLWFPGAGFKRWASEVKHEVLRGIDTLFDAAKHAIELGGHDSVVMRLIDNTHMYSKDPAEAEEMFKGVAATTYVAGADTTNATTQAFFLAMALYPDVQKRAHAEVDAVVGRGRLPEFSDRKSLPYIDALVKELLRWHVITPIGIPHRVVADDIYGNYLIPGGATVMVNVWGILNDPVTYPHPKRFDPERFLKDGLLDTHGRDPADFAFGFGRRVCPGQPFAESSLFILCASLLWAFNIEKPIDEQGCPVDIEYSGTTDSVFSHPAVHDYRITARSPEAEQLILEQTLAT